MTRAAPAHLFIRSLAVPWSLGSALFVLATALLLTLLQAQGVLGSTGSLLLLSWLFKYAYVLLAHVANGHTEAPAVSAEMLSPFEQRPLMLLLWALLAFAAFQVLGPRGGWLVTSLLALMLPASVAVLGLGWGAGESLNPVTLLRMVRGLGWHFAAILGLIAGSLLVAIASSALHWAFLWRALVGEMLLLTVFCAIGGALYDRRSEVGHEPVKSPERDATRTGQAHAQALSRLLDGMFAQVRTDQRPKAMNQFREWLGQVEDRQLTLDVRQVVDRIATWEDARFLKRICEVLSEELQRRDLAPAARDLAKYAQRYEPTA